MGQKCVHCRLSITIDYMQFDADNLLVTLHYGDMK